MHWKYIYSAVKIIREIAADVQHKEKKKGHVYADIISNDGDAAEYWSFQKQIELQLYPNENENCHQDRFNMVYVTCLTEIICAKWDLYD